MRIWAYVEYALLIRRNGEPRCNAILGLVYSDFPSNSDYDFIKHTDLVYARLICLSEQK